MSNFNFLQAIDKLEYSLKNVLRKLEDDVQNNIQEVRLRLNNPLIIKVMGKNYYINKLGQISEFMSNDLCVVKLDQINQSVERMCEYSFYAYQDQINNGFITLNGGHRVGICGTAIMKDGKIVNINNITSLNIRIARCVNNVSDELVQLTMKDKLRSILICGCPGSGKTTIIKDLIKQIAIGKLGRLYNISVIDERGEMAGGFNTQDMDIGSADIFDGYQKASGMMMAIRTMAPDIIVCDEIGTEQEVIAIESALNAGVKIVATVHAGSEDEAYRKPQIQKLISLKVFDVMVILDSGSNLCKIKKIIYLN